MVNENGSSLKTIEHVNYLNCKPHDIILVSVSLPKKKGNFFYKRKKKVKLQAWSLNFESCA